jgi:hypothetical protein
MFISSAMLALRDLFFCYRHFIFGHHRLPAGRQVASHSCTFVFCSATQLHNSFSSFDLLSAAGFFMLPGHNVTVP